VAAAGGSSSDHAAAHHHHGHSKQHSETRAAQRFGIRSFVYDRRRPFHLKR
jgi:G3E family GTPase